MKLKNLFMATMALLAFTACTDIPDSPYDFPTNEGGNGTTEEGVYINETFTSDFGVFTPVETVGDTPWVIDYKTAKATSYIDGTNKAATSWLISSPIDFTGETEAYAAFEYIIRYSESGKVAANHQLLISDNYSGDAAAATWVDLPYGAVEGSDWATFYKANVAIPAEFLDKSGIVVALRYTATTKASTWEVKNFKVAHGTGETPEEPAEAEEYTVSEALAAFTGAAKPAVVKGYIVGTINGQVYAEGCVFSGTAESKTNLLLADTPDETDYNNCIPVQLPSGTVRNALNLVDNPGLYLKEVKLTGSLEKYFGVAGLKSVSKYSIDGVTPEEPGDTPVSGENILTNSDFEIWENGKPAGWALTVTNSTYSQSTDAHSGVSSVLIEGDAQSNKRLASKSYTLKAGTYHMSAYFKQSGSTAGQFRLGYAKLTNGVVADTQNDYIYITSATAVSQDWQETKCEFTLSEETEVGIIIMNSKYGAGASILVDDVTIVTSDGGVVNGSTGEEPETPSTGEALFAETFSTSLGSFTTQQTIGDFAWKFEEYNGKGYAKVSGYDNGASQEAESWLISPAINFTGVNTAYISFDYVINKGDASLAATNHKVAITDNYTGDVATTEWTYVDFGAYNDNTWSFKSTGKIALPETMMNKANIVIVFKYNSTSTNSSTWEMNNLVVAYGEGSTPETPDTPDNPGEEPETPDTPDVPTGDNLLANGSFEEWNGSLPTAWGKDDSNASAHSATIEQSTEAYDGNYAVIVKGDKTNKRLASKSYTLPAGTYSYTIYVKTNGSEAGHCRIGYVPIADGKAGTYVYEEAAAAAVTDNWTAKTLEFTLAEETTVSFVVMNNKTGNGASFLVDNATLTAN